MTGPELIAFINQEEAVRPDGKKGAGLFAYLRSLQSANGDRRDVIANVFEGTVNRMINGYLLARRHKQGQRNSLHVPDEIHTLGHLYESMLREMRDAAGDSGEFYTPRALVKFMVTVVDPRLGETVLDPAAGTGGFLVEAFEHLKEQCKKAEDFTWLQKATLHGVEAKPLPYLLCQMNLLLHGVEYPEIDPRKRSALHPAGDRRQRSSGRDHDESTVRRGGGAGNSLQFPGRQADGGDCTPLSATHHAQATTTCWGIKGRTCGMVVPNGVLFGDGVCARIKEELLKEFNLHTIVRLPNGVFAPYTPIPTNLLFFDRTGPTKHIWYYEQPSPEGRKNYTKTSPIQFEEFAPCVAWWKKREGNERAWKVSAKEVMKYDTDGNLLAVNLDIKNPTAKEDITHLPPEQLAESILQKERRIAEIVTSIKELLADTTNEG